LTYQGRLLKSRHFGTENDRKLKKLRPLVEKINGLEPQFEGMTDDALKSQTDAFKQRYKDGESLEFLHWRLISTPSQVTACIL